MPLRTYQPQTQLIKPPVLFCDRTFNRAEPVLQRGAKTEYSTETEAQNFYLYREFFAEKTLLSYEVDNCTGSEYSHNAQNFITIADIDAPFRQSR
jgi:hypothetical protein